MNNFFDTLVVPRRTHVPPFRAKLRIPLALACGAYLLAGCAITRTTMADASVPASEQSLIIMSGSGMAAAVLVNINNTSIDKAGEQFYIPAGTHRLEFRTSSYTTVYRGNERIDTRERATFEINGTFLAGHTYRIQYGGGSETQIEDITGHVAWKAPSVSPAAPKNGVLTDWGRPRGGYVIPIINAGLFAEYTDLPGKEALILGWKVNENYNRDRDRVIYSEGGHTGIEKYALGMAAQGGLEVGMNQVGLSLLAEINGGIGLGGTTSEASFVNRGYLFLGELYYDKIIGVGFGYGKKTTLFDFLGNARVANRAAYENDYPFYRFELLFMPKRIMPVTLYGDYYFEHDAWGVGIRMNIARKGERAFPGKMLQ